MLNMKKGLAIVLAAATALTFAPVSTLGLTGVVEAKAATTTEIIGTTAADGTSFAATADLTSGDAGTWDATTTAAAFANATADVTSGDQYFIVEITGTAQNDEYTVNTDAANGVVERYAAGESGANKGQTTVKLGADKKAKVVFHALKKGTVTVTITNGTGADAKVLTLNFAVAGKASSVKFNAGTEANDTLNLYAKGNDTGETVTLNFGTSENGNHYAFNLDKSNSIKFKTGSNPDTDATVSGGQATVTLQYSKASTNTLYVYGSGADAAAKKDPIGSLRINVLSTDFGVTAQDLTIGEAGKFSYTSTSTNTPAVKITDANDKDVTSDFQIDEGTAAADSGDRFTSTSTTTANSVNYIWVTPVDSTAGSYKVTLTQLNADGSTYTSKSASFKVKSAEDPDNTLPSTSDVYGGVTTNLLVTDNTTYSLVDSTANFKLNNTWYTADQLKWYLKKNTNADPNNMGFTQGSATISSDNTGKLNITVARAGQFQQDVNPSGGTSAKIVGVYTQGAKDLVVYSGNLTVQAIDNATTKTYDAGTIATDRKSVNKSVDDAKDLRDNFLDGVTFIGTNNKYLNAGNSTITTSPEYVTGRNFTADIKTAGSGNDNTAKGSTIKASSKLNRDGVYSEKYYVEYTDNTPGETATFVAEISVKVSVSAGPEVAVREGDFTYSRDTKNAVDRDTAVIDLDLTTNKTFDIAAHTYSNKDNTTYSYIADTQNVTVDAKGVVSAAKVGTAVVEIVPKADGVEGGHVFVFFRVSQNANDSIAVTGKDGDKATVLTTRQYNGNRSKLNSEKALAAAQVGYVQVEVTGDENNDVKEDLTVKGAGKLSYALANDPVHGESVDAKTGQITISHDWLKNNTNPAYIFPVKVVSTETNSSALTTGYFYVVVDFADATITGLENSYNVGASYTGPGRTAWLNLGNNDVYGPQHVSSNAEITVDPIQKSAELDDSKVYDNDDISSFVPDHTAIKRAIVAGKTEHVLVSASDTAHKIGQTYKVVTITSVAGQANYVTKIENVDTGKTIYDQSTAAVSGASITIDKPTVVKVTVAHAPSAALDPKYDPAFTIGDGDHYGFNYNTEHLFVAATENPATYEITLIPSVEGTQIVKINPTDVRLSSTDYSLVGTEYFNLAVKYSTADSKTPAQVKGVKLGNKKGAKVVVKFTKDTTDKNIKYYVQKKVGKKTSGKSVGSNRTILSVKKGATVKVRVKAYYYDANGVKHVGKYSKWVTKKTDKK